MWKRYVLFFCALILCVGCVKMDGLKIHDLPRNLLDLECAVDSDCAAFADEIINSTCLLSHCVCWKESVSVDCKPMKTLVSNTIGGPCPCSQANARCDRITNKCVCKANFLPSPDRLRCIKETIALGEKCENNAQCITFDHFAECDLARSICLCQKGFTLVDDTCHSVVDIDGNCSDDSECQSFTEHSECLKRKCVCRYGYVKRTNHSECLPNADHGENCTDTVQCQHKLGAGSVCENGVCACDENHLKMLNEYKRIKCQRRIEIGDMCSEHTDCYKYNLSGQEQTMECVSGSCTCRNGYDQVKLYCAKKSDASKAMLSTLVIFFAIFSIVMF